MHKAFEHRFGKVLAKFILRCTIVVDRGNNFLRRYFMKKCNVTEQQREFFKSKICEMVDCVNDVEQLEYIFVVVSDIINERGAE